MKKIAMKIIAVMLTLILLLSSIAAIAESYGAAVTASSMTIYADAAMTQSLGTLPYHTLVTVTAVKDSVAQLSVDGSTAYAKLSNVTAISEIARKATVNTTTRVYETADTSSRSSTLSKGTTVYVLAVKNNCAMIVNTSGTQVGYTYTSCLTYESASQAASTESGSAGQTAQSTAISTTSSSVVIENIEAVVNVTSVTVYKSASTNSSKLGTLSYGAAVTVCAYNSNWAYISKNGRYGFCKLSALRRATAGDVPQAPGENEVDSGNKTSVVKPDTAIKATVTDSTLRVYKSASTSSTSLGTIKKGTQVNVVAYNKTWAYIELNGNYGYCKLSGLSKVASNEGNSTGTVTKIGTATVITATANIYASASESASSTKIAIGTTVDVFKYDSSWVYVGLNGKYGYMKVSTLNASSYAEYESGDSSDAVTNMEKALLKLGYFDGAPSASYNAHTTAAIERFQSACGMTVTGKADEATQRVLYGGYAPASPMLSVSLSSGSTSTNVSRLQNRLYSLGYLSKASSVDGDYGSITSAAVKLFQSAAGISATGSADNKTIQALYSVSAPSLPSSAKAADASSTSTSSTANSNLSTSGGVTGNTTSMPSTLASTTSTYSDGMSNAAKLEYVIYWGQNQLGKPYVYGSTGPNSFDCSGFTYFCFKKIGITLPHSAYSSGYNNKYEKIATIPELKRGDLVFFNTISDGDLSDHTGIYLGANSFIHASSGGSYVIVSTLAKGYYNRVFSWGRRVLNT